MHLTTARLVTAMTTILLSVGCSSSESKTEAKKANPPTQKPAPVETSETSPSGPAKDSAKDADGRSGEGGSCLGAAGLACRAGLTCMARGTGGVCRRPATGGACGTALCDSEEYCCSEKYNRCQLVGTTCYGWLATEPGSRGTRCGGAAADDCMPGLQCVSIQDRLGGDVVRSSGHCQGSGFEGTTCELGGKESCRGGFVCTKTQSGARCRMPAATSDAP